MSSSKATSLTSDQNTPDNKQDLQNTRKKKKNTDVTRNIPMGCSYQVEWNTTPSETTREEKEEEIEAEQLDLEESALGQFSKPIYKGEGFRRVSDFQDSECGEPAKNQHLRLDFSPIEGVDDNEYIVNKCRKFWTLIERNPNIKGLMALPVINKCEISPTKSVSFHVKSEPTALDWLKQKELMSKAFNTQHKKQYCDDASGENCSTWLSPKEEKKNKAGSSDTSTRSASRKRVLEPSSSENLHSSQELTALCKQLEEWDLSHPRIMDPPGHPPNLSHAMMQIKK